MKIKNIVIVGGGTSGWFTAGALSKVYDQFNITLIESPDIPKIGVGESVTPHVQGFFDFLEIDTKHWMNETGAVYKLANKFTGWITGDQNESEYFGFSYPSAAELLYRETSELVSYNDLKYPESTVKTTDIFSQLLLDGSIDKFDRYWSSAYHYMEKNVSPFLNDKYLLNQFYSWSQHINADKCGDYVRDFIALPNGVKHISKKVIEVKCEQDKISSVVLEDGEVVTADLFVDASGFARLLVKALNWNVIPYKDYAIDTAVVAQLEYNDIQKELVNYTQSIAQPNGWMFKIGLYHRMGCGLCFSSSHLDVGQAIDEYKKLNSNRRVEPRVLSWKPARLEQFANGNVATVGLCSGFYEPLEANALYILISGIYELINSLDGYKETGNLDWSTYNKKLAYTIDDLTDFIKIHYTLSKRTDTDFWNDMRSIGDKERHEDLIFQKYSDGRNSITNAKDHWTLFAEYMWLQLAASWKLDLSKFKKDSITKNHLNLGRHYFTSKEVKHNLISDDLPNNYEWLKENIFQGVDYKTWERKYLK